MNMDPSAAWFCIGLCTGVYLVILGLFIEKRRR